jgi:hypothetical protein
MDRTAIQVHVLTGKMMFCSQPQSVCIEGPLDTKKNRFMCALFVLFLKGCLLLLKKT